MSAKEKGKGFIGEFKEFIARGNVMDMAVGVIIGGAFGKISTSLVNDIIMPFISMLTGGIDFNSWKWVLRPEVVDASSGEVVTAAVSVNFGTFLATILDFIIVAFAIFCVIKAINAMHRKKEEPAPAPAPEPEPSNEEKLLAEIRDLLKKD